MEKTLKFFNWFTSNGGGFTSENSIANIHQIVNYIPLQISSSLKSRSQEIKQKHNHCFNFKNRSSNGN